MGGELMDKELINVKIQDENMTVEPDVLISDVMTEVPAPDVRTQESVEFIDVL